MSRIKENFLNAFFLLTVAAIGASAQQATPTPAPSPSDETKTVIKAETKPEIKPETKPAPLAGAYRTIPSRSREVRAAYAFAVKTQDAETKKKVNFVRVLKAESQVVAGTYYRICMLVREGKGRSKSVTTVLNRDPKSVWSMTAWVEGGCKEI